MSTKQIIGAAVCTFLLGLATGRFTLPAKVVTKTITKEVEVVHENEQVKRNVSTVVTTKPDGTKVEQVLDLSTVQNVTVVDDKKDAYTEHVTTYNKPTLMIGAGAGINANALKNGLVYTAQAQKRLLGPVWLGLSMQSDRFVGLSVHLEF